MPQLLYINSSPRRSGSVSRELSAEFVRRWQAAHPAAVVVERDLTAAPLPHLDEAAIAAFFTPEDQRTAAQAGLVARSDALIDELLASDVVVIAAPMYNFSVTSHLKAWIDHVLRAGRTFKYAETGPVGLVPADKRVVVFTASGGIYTEGPAKTMDFHETYLRGVLAFIGIVKPEFVHTEGLALGPDAAAKAIDRTRSTIERLVSA